MLIGDRRQAALDYVASVRRRWAWLLANLDMPLAEAEARIAEVWHPYHRALRQLLGNALAASVFSAFLVLPAIWLGNGSNVLLIPCKTFLTVAALGLLTRFLPWNQLTAAMRVFHLPQVVIFIFDTTLRYIVLLGEIAGEMLTALKLRSIGHNPHKGRAISGILGVMFLRSREMSEEMYQAMVCRGYTGEYLVATARGRHRGGFWLALLFLLFVVLYLRIEVLL